MAVFTINGTRGTMPACGNQYVRYGGDTTCYSIQTDTGIIIVDAGTGIAQIGKQLAACSPIPPITVLFTHFHMDHVIGLPCFYPLYRPDARFTILADPRRKMSWKETLETFIHKPYWPVGLGETDADMTLTDLPIEKGFIEPEGIRITWFRVPHPQQCLSYRVEMPGNTVIIATDVEYPADGIKDEFVDFCRGADFLVFDSQYKPEEYEAHRGWGHSTWETGVEIARRADIGQLILTHHEPDRTDDQVDEIVAAAKAQFSNTVGAMEGMILKP